MTLNRVNPEEKGRERGGEGKKGGEGYYFTIRTFDVHVPSCTKKT